MSALAPIALRGVRGMIAQRMHESLQATAQLSFWARLDADPLVRARAAWKAAGLAAGYEDLVIAVLPALLAQHPTFNAVEQEGALVPQGQVHVSCAIALASGLKAPTLFDAQDLDLAGIATRRRDLVERARSDSLSVKEMSGGTITLSNLGGTRVEGFTPILNRPQQALIGLGRIGLCPRITSDGAVSAGREMIVSLTVDHRFHDGGAAGDFLTGLCDQVERALPLP